MPTTRAKKTYIDHAGQQGRAGRIDGALPGTKQQNKKQQMKYIIDVTYLYTAIDLVLVKIEQKLTKQGLSRAN